MEESRKPKGARERAQGVGDDVVKVREAGLSDFESLEANIIEGLVIKA
eukprot:CAMPEP_0174268668 /NCGR_PEP_ID=MMETSP0439-20130205/38256_1 /TAXON_ID=0 /ORGANISM="Stereomyxa ramosa, Strain Chinc5" /LENGTH=47 /DNA_ID= /DNA_START= /DNA_END= /DNA_ORIENTATION=